MVLSWTDLAALSFIGLVEGRENMMFLLFSRVRGGLFFLIFWAHLMQPSESLMLSVNIWLLRLKVNIRNCGSGNERQVRRKQGAMAFCSQKSVSVDAEG